MNMVQQKNDICKEILTILAYFNEDLLEKIPNKILKELKELAADSKANFYIDIEKNLTNQNISEESKDFISLLYYIFIADEYEKKSLLAIWDKNENEYQKKLRQKYDPDKIFQNRIKESSMLENTLSSNTSMMIYKKETLLDKIKKLIKSYKNYR